VRLLARGAAALLVATFPVALGLSQIPGSAYDSNFDIFQQLVNSPFDVALPLFAVLLGCLPAFNRARYRFAFNTRGRLSVTRFILRNVAGCAVLPFVTFFVWPMLAIVVAYLVWPLIGNPAIEPRDSFMTSAQAITESYKSVSYSQLLAHGTLVYALAYSAWLGLGASVFAVVGFLALVVIPNRIFALSVPLIIFIGQTLAAGLVGGTYDQLMVSLFPFGIVQTSITQAAMPMLALIIATVIATIFVVRNVRRRGWLT
jgi:hypothetical protein